MENLNSANNNSTQLPKKNQSRLLITLAALVVVLLLVVITLLVLQNKDNKTSSQTSITITTTTVVQSNQITLSLTKQSTINKIATPNVSFEVPSSYKVFDLTGKDVFEQSSTANVDKDERLTIGTSIGSSDTFAFREISATTAEKTISDTSSINMKNIIASLFLPQLSTILSGEPITINNMNFDKIKVKYDSGSDNSISMTGYVYGIRVKGKQDTVYVVFSPDTKVNLADFEKNVLGSLSSF